VRAKRKIGTDVFAFDRRLRFISCFMRRLNLLLSLTIVLTACGRPTARVVSITPQIPATFVFPPTWTPTPIGVTPGPSIVPTISITRTIAPPATPAASIVYSTTDRLITLNAPSNWTTQAGHRQLLATTTQKFDYLQITAPGTPPQPAIIIFYNWPAMEAIDNTTAWQQAYALASLAIKSCAMILTDEVGKPIALAGEDAQVLGYQDECGEQGELIGLVHHTVNVGILIEAPQPIWLTWQPILRNIIGSMMIGK
jgi:hypothetical protein